MVTKSLKQTFVTATLGLPLCALSDHYKVNTERLFWWLSSHQPEQLNDKTIIKKTDISIYGERPLSEDC